MRAPSKSAVYPFLGENKSIADVEQARVALATAYSAAGYGAVYVDIPEQAVDEGIVRLKVTEGRIDRVRVTGARYFSNGSIHEALPSLEQGKPLHLPELQAELAEVGKQSRDRQITPVLRAGRTPGTVDVDLKVQDHLPVHGSVSVNDRYTSDTSHTRANVVMSYDNLWQKFHSLSLQYQTAPERRSDAQVLAATYVAPLPESGNVLAVYAVDTDSDVQNITTAVPGSSSLSVLGKGRIYGLRYIVPLTPHGFWNGSVSLGADYKDFKESILSGADAAANTPISYLNWSLGWNGSELAERSRTDLGLTANFGIRGLANGEEEFWFKRSTGKPNKGDPSYFYLRASAAREQLVYKGWSAYLRLAGQYTPQTLISNEQFSIGGAESVRGYLESEELGDYGVGGTFEVRTPSLLKLLGSEPASLRFLGFFDAGVLSINEPLANQKRRADLQSWGVGLRFQAFAGLDAMLDWATPLTDSEHIEAGDSRIHFQLQYGF